MERLCLAWLLLARLAMVSLAVAPGPAAAASVDLALVLAVDASGSIDAGEYRLQREGYAAAIADARVLRAIRSGRHQAIAVAFVEWGSPGAPKLIIDWTRIDGPETAAAFAAAVIAAPRQPQSYNAIGDAVDLAVTLIRANPFAAERAVIDVSGDGPDMRGVRPAPLARDEAVAAGITINALVIDEGRMVGGPGGEPLAQYYAREIIGGPGAFVHVAKGYPAFAAAILTKLVREIAGEDVPADTRLAADGTPARSTPDGRPR